MAEILTVTFPLPPQVLSPNARQGRTKEAQLMKAARIARCRQDAFLAVKAEMNRLRERGGWEYCRAQETYWWPNAIRRDIRNAEGNRGVKAYYDGAVDAGLIVDDSSKHLVFGPTLFRIDRLDSRLVISFEKLESLDEIMGYEE